jgi:hypothetical protein
VRTLHREAVARSRSSRYRRRRARQVNGLTLVEAFVPFILILHDGFDLQRDASLSVTALSATKQLD